MAVLLILKKHLEQCRCCESDYGSFVKKLKEATKKELCIYRDVIPAQAEIQDTRNMLKKLDSCFRRNDNLCLLDRVFNIYKSFESSFSTFY
jgi:hypothetical protein